MVTRGNEEWFRDLRYLFSIPISLEVVVVKVLTDRWGDIGTQNK